jgi:tRNA-dihydrouridine synthase
MQRSELMGRLRGSLFISAMFGRTDGAFVAQHGAAASMVQLGAFIADAEDRTHDPAVLLPESRQEMVPILSREVDIARQTLGDIPVAVNAAAGDLESAVNMAQAFHEAGGDLFELNVHGGYGKLLDRGLLRAMALPIHRPMLLEWLGRLCALDVPVIVKFWAGMPGVDFVALLQDMAGIAGLFGVHLNVRSEQAREPDVEFVRTIRPHVPGALLCSGYVTTHQQAAALFAAGADCVGIAQGILDEPGIMARLGAEAR